MDDGQIQQWICFVRNGVVLVHQHLQQITDLNLHEYQVEIGAHFHIEYSK